MSRRDGWIGPRLCALLCCALLLTACSTIATAETHEAAAEREIRATLEQWTQDFNAGDADKACALFAPGLIANFQGVPERGYAEQCALLKDSLPDPSRKFTYALDIKEIIVAGDLAVVRLIWTLTVEADDPPGETVSHEIGLDVFKRQPDSAWKIIRYMAFEEK